MIKSEIGTAQPANERYTDRRTDEDRQPGRTQTRVGHDEHAQKGARRA
jgi:hypothetical protein